MSLKNFIHKKEFLFLFIILLLGFLLRVHGLGNGAMWLDETISSLAAREILEKGIPVFDSGLFYSRALFFHYLQAGFMLLGQSDFTARLVSVFFGLLTIMLAYSLGKEFNQSIGIIASLFTSIFILEIIYSRQARFYQMFQFLFFLTIFLLYKSGAKETRASQKKRYAWIATFLLIVLVNTHIAGLVLLPFFFILFWREQKDRKLLIIPLLFTVYYIITLFGLSYGNQELASNYAEQYSSQLYTKMRAFLLISFLGIYPAVRKNLKLFLLLIIPSLVLFASLFFIKVFAIRYVYFLVFPVIIFLSLAIYETRKIGKIVLIIITLFAVIYPSNIFFQYNSLTLLTPTQLERFAPTEPVIDYKSLSDETKQIIQDNILLTLSSPGVKWYLKKPDYVIPFSLNGLNTGYALFNEHDAYTGADIYNNQIKHFILVEDEFGYGKLNSIEKKQVNDIKENCPLLERTYSLKVYDCREFYSLD